MVEPVVDQLAFFNFHIIFYSRSNLRHPSFCLLIMLRKAVAIFCTHQNLSRFFKTDLIFQSGVNHFDISQPWFNHFILVEYEVLDWLKIAIESLIKVIPGISNLMLISVLCILPFSILGATFYRGLLFSCNKDNIPGGRQD
jgi:hypothetical protein